MSDTSEIFETTELNEWNKTVRELTYFFRDLVIILIIVLIIRMFIVTPFRINGSSMETSYHDKEYILVDKFSYLNFASTYGAESSTDSLTRKIEDTLLGSIPIHIGDPKRGDVVVITPHVDKDREYYIKRVIGLPGDTIRFQDGEVWIKNANTISGEFTLLDEYYLSLSNKGNTRLPESVDRDTFQIPEWYYWVMGDNRNNSADSRQCFQNCFVKDDTAHFIKRKDIIGKVLLNFGYFNIFNAWGLLQDGKFSWTYPPRFLSHPRTAEYPQPWL
jgi:signal peptidase I